MIKDTEFEIDYQRVLITMSLLKAVEDSDYTQRHSLRVGRLVKLVAQELGLDLKTANLVTRAAYYHDVGKIKISKEILFKLKKLTDEEYKLIKKHPKDGADILRSLGMNAEAEIVRLMIERTNGPVSVVADHTKWDTVSNFEVAHIDQAQRIITDQELGPIARETLLKLSVDVIDPGAINNLP